MVPRRAGRRCGGWVPRDGRLSRREWVPYPSRTRTDSRPRPLVRSWSRPTDSIVSWTSTISVPLAASLFRRADRSRAGQGWAPQVSLGWGRPGPLCGGDLLDSHHELSLVLTGEQALAGRDRALTSPH